VLHDSTAFPSEGNQEDAKSSSTISAAFVAIRLLFWSSN
jgi:hypothetical protein